MNKRFGPALEPVEDEADEAEFDVAIADSFGFDCDCDCDCDCADSISPGLNRLGAVVLRSARFTVALIEGLLLAFDKAFLCESGTAVAVCEVKFGAAVELRVSF